MVLGQEVAAFELASLELAGGLYANDCALTAPSYAAFDPRIAMVREGVANAAGVALLLPDGQMAGTLQADMSCICSASVAATTQTVITSVAGINGQSGANLSPQAYGTAVATSLGASGSDIATTRVFDAECMFDGISAGDWRIGAYATTAFDQSAWRTTQLSFAGQSTSTTNMNAAGLSAPNYRAALVLEGAYAAAGNTYSRLAFSAYGSTQLHIDGASVSQYYLPNARRFSILQHAYDITVRTYEIRSTLRPIEVRGTKRPQETRNSDLSTQPRIASWS